MLIANRIPAKPVGIRVGLLELLDHAAHVELRNNIFVIRDQIVTDWDSLDGLSVTQHLLPPNAALAVLVNANQTRTGMGSRIFRTGKAAR